MNHYDLEEVEVLDLFAGTGSITYEFASRGARGIVSVESDPVHFAFIRKTCAQLGLDQVSVLRTDAFRYLHHPPQQFDIVFADPPYDHPLLEQIPSKVFETDLLSPEGLLILEHPSRIEFPAHPRFREQRKYGGVNFSFFSGI
jgi:16S rRNA (guanine(966)-N(2))-methyltransferase RsmD